MVVLCCILLFELLVVLFNWIWLIVAVRLSWVSCGCLVGLVVAIRLGWVSCGCFVGLG